MTRQLEAMRSAIATNPTFVGGDREVVVAVYDALADGETPSVASIAGRLGCSVAAVEYAIERCTVFYEGESIVGFGGLSATPTAHSFHIRGRRLYTWCAWDPLFLAPILGQDASVETTCPVTGASISLSVGRDGVRDVAPGSAVLSMKVPDEASTADLVSNFCGLVLLFASADAAHTWTRHRPETFVLSVEEAFELGQLIVRQRAG